VASIVGGTNAVKRENEDEELDGDVSKNKKVKLEDEEAEPQDEDDKTAIRSVEKYWTRMRIS
jgi:hypothetical protein